MTIPVSSVGCLKVTENPLPLTLSNDFVATTPHPEFGVVTFTSALATPVSEQALLDLAKKLNTAEQRVFRLEKDIADERDFMREHNAYLLECMERLQSENAELRSMMAELRKTAERRSKKQSFINKLFPPISYKSENES